MKRPKDMSREELIEEIISITKRLEEIDAARKETNRQIAEPSKQEELLTGIKKAISNGRQDISEFIPKFRDFINLRMKGLQDCRMRLMQWRERLFTGIIAGDFDFWKLVPRLSA